MSQASSLHRTGLRCRSRSSHPRRRLSIVRVEIADESTHCSKLSPGFTSLSRTSQSVVEQLLEEMRRLVHSYRPESQKTGRSISELISGTAFFPGGSDLWRGQQSFGRLPGDFPEEPLMFVGHNFGSIRAHEKAQIRGGGAMSFFWRTLVAYLTRAGFSPEEGFFTNALMGLKPGGAVGDMPTVPGYEDECQQFLVRQIEIVRPAAIAALGHKAGKRVHKAGPSVPFVVLLHPPARELKPFATRESKIAAQAKVLADLRTSIRSARTP
jgi:hypothetical protein